MTDPVSSTNSALLVDPDPESLEAIEKGLQESRLDPISTDTVSAAIELAEHHRPRLIVSELVLPDGSGFALCRRLRESACCAQIPVVLMSRWSLEGDRILAFECGADDFVAKPFFARELASRFRAVLRRSAGAATDEEGASSARGAKPVAIELDQARVFVAGAPVPLTPREFALLAALVRRRGRVLTRGELIDQAWGDGEGPSARSVDAHVKSLRRKLGESREAIETVRGLGYRFSESLVPPIDGDR
jgi:DNA-binding response OmpR family regulator